MEGPAQDPAGLEPVAGPLPPSQPEPTSAFQDPVRVPLADDATTHFFAPVEMNAALNRENGSGKRNGKKSPACLFCYSLDTMEPFRRSSHVAILSRFMPRLRWRYCRSCTRHFLAFIGRPQRA